MLPISGNVILTNLVICFESGIRRLDKYPLKGIVWYQGESNAHNKEAHEKLFKLLVDSWRSNWDETGSAFLLCATVKHRPPVVDMVPR